ncbi:hypothetical protein [Nitrososphaera viennensis]|uniref:Uncharacterized protein n=2 Tax=Nitrososphaera viennensis TaxID=1034015 RepID=A0A060HMG5_9ARCH|nr:hypothetical protein [Nitrososphaera viennensis]AIC16678.1 hypothetical protein NVIE_024130 [Nitrososphaera viennensis EN76]UVS68599.1 hypothetical protein NWT39_11905 [Nitrososphaera viennensis]
MLDLLAKPERSATRQARFLICNECFWCASCLDPGFAAGSCPSCNAAAVEGMPISPNERYTFDYSANSGVVLEFTPEGRAKSRAGHAA